MTTTTTRDVTLPAEAVELLQRLLADVDAAETAKQAAADAADAGAESGHRDWEAACRDESTARWSVVAAVRRYL
jgi:hypothetical protein